MGLIGGELRLPLTPLAAQYHDARPRCAARSRLPLTENLACWHSNISRTRSAAAALVRRADRRARLGGCETTTLDRQEDRLQVGGSSAPALEIPPDLTTPALRRPLSRIATASGAAAARAAGKTSELLPRSAGGAPGPRRLRALAGREDVRPKRRGPRCTSSGRRTASSSRSSSPRSASWRPTGRRTAPTLRRKRLREVRRQVPRLPDRYLPAGQVPHAHRARRRAGHGRDLHQPPRRRSSCRPRPRAARPRIGIWQPTPPNPELEAEFLSAADGQVRHAAGAGASGRGGAARSSLARARIEKAGDGASARRRRCLRPCLAARRSRARPHRVHGRRPRPLEGPVLRPLFQSRSRPDEEQGLARDASSSGRPATRTSPSNTASSSRRPIRTAS